MVWDVPFTVAVAVLITGGVLVGAVVGVGVVPPLLPVVVEPELPQATTVRTIKIILMPRNIRLRDSICDFLLLCQNQGVLLLIITYVRGLHYLSYSIQRQGTARAIQSGTGVIR